MRKVLFFYEGFEEQPASEGEPVPDRDGFFRDLARAGIAAERVSPFRRPWNPFARGHPFWRSLDPARAFWAAFSRRDATAIVSHGESGALVPLLLRPFTGKKVFVIHDVDHANWRPRKYLQAFVIPRADRMLTATRAQQNYLSRLYTLRSPPCLVGPRIDDSFSSSSGAPPEDYVLAVGNDAARDFGMLAEAVAPLDLSLRLLTRRPVDIPPEARCRVERITRHVSFTELRDLYDQARFVLLPLKERMSPGGMTSLLEAMAMGKAVVMTFSSGVVEFVEDGVTGIVVPLGDAAAFRAAVERLWGDPALAEAMGRAARRRFEAECSTARFAQRLAAVLAE